MKKLYEILKKNQENEILIVGSYTLKKEVLKNYLHKRIQNIKFITKNKLISELTFTYDDEAIYALMKEYGYSYDVSKLYLDNLKYIYFDDSNLEQSEKEKINFLKEIFSFLLKTKHISYNKNYGNYLKDFSKKHKLLICEDVRKEDQFFLKDINYTCVKEEVQRKALKAVVCSTFEEELFNMFEKISELIDNKTSPKDILIVYKNSDKDELFKRMSKLYNIPINSLYQTSLTEYPIVNEYLQGTNPHNITFKEQMLINEISEKIECDEIYLNYLKRKYQSKVIKRTYEDGIDIISLEDVKYYENKHIFILNCNQGKLLNLVKDEDYLKDKTKAKMGINTSVDNNIYSKTNLLEALYSDNNIYLSLSKNDKKQELFEEVFIKEENVQKEDFNLAYSKYSSDYNKVLLTRYLDDYYKYNIVRKGLKELYHTYDCQYRTFNNKYKFENSQKILAILNGEIKLSYSQVNEYNKCAFAYYLKKILKIDNDNKDSFSAFLGSLYHYVLSKAFISDFDFEKCFSEFIDKEINSGKIELCARDKFLLKKLKEELKYIIAQISEQNKFILYKEAAYEKSVEISRKIQFKGQEFKAIFRGFIDKIYFKVLGDKKYVAIVDYKTGNDDLNLDFVKYGLNLQLPIYLYLIKNLKGFEESFVYGFYLQNILHNEISAETDEEYKKEKAKRLQLNGYSLDNFPIEAKFDETMEKSLVISSMKKNKDGSYSKNAKVLTITEMNNLYDTVSEKIDDVYKGILDCNFNINPKYIFNQVDSCIHCKFKDICYKNEQDYIDLESKKVNSKGENDGLD